ncbi:MAG: GrpB family protein [Chloroflexota bacterium]|nr:GrpB family protein [Chloroflexota bacterium]
MPSFQLADDLLPRARALLERERDRLHGVVDGTLELTGGSSVPGALTGGDVDLHLRVPPDSLGSAVEALRDIYDVVLPEIWSETLATFYVRGDERIGVAVTPIGSEHDRRFVGAWDRLRGDPGLLAAYNAMKMAHADADEDRYRAAKAAFFDGIDGSSGST